MKKVLLINGPYLNKTGTREPEIYGTQTMDDIVAEVRKRGEELGIAVDYFQSDSETELVIRIWEARGLYGGIIINPGVFTHAGTHIRDTLLRTGIPTVEVHLSNVFARESFRHVSMTAGACLGQIAGFKGFGYVLALEALEKNEELGTGTDEERNGHGKASG